MEDDTVYSYAEHKQTVWSFLIGNINYALVADDGTADDVVLANLQSIQDCLSASMEVLDERESSGEDNSELSLKDVVDLVLDTIHSVTGISLTVVGVGPVIIEIADADDTEEEAG